jgi:hypothetical protein
MSWWAYAIRQIDALLIALKLSEIKVKYTELLLCNKIRVDFSSLGVYFNDEKLALRGSVFEINLRVITVEGYFENHIQRWKDSNPIWHAIFAHFL